MTPTNPSQKVVISGQTYEGWTRVQRRVVLNGEMSMSFDSERVSGMAGKGMDGRVAPTQVTVRERGTVAWFGEGGGSVCEE